MQLEDPRSAPRLPRVGHRRLPGASASAVAAGVLVTAVLAGCAAPPLALRDASTATGKSVAATTTEPGQPAQAAGAAASATATPAAAQVASWTPAASGRLLKKAARFRTVPAPKGLAITPDNREVWVTALVTRPSIGIYDPKTGEVRGKIDLGKNGAVEVIFNRDGTKAYASQMQSHRVYEIDVKKRKVVRKYNTRSPWTKVVVLSPDESRLYAANWSGDTVSEIDLDSGKVLRRLKTADTPRGLYVTPDGKKLYVACFGEQTLKGKIQVIDLATGKRRTIGRGRAMRHMVADERGGRLFTSDLGANCIWVTDLATDETTFFAKTDNKPNTIDISPDGRVLFVSNRGANNPESYSRPGPEWGSVLLLDTRTGKPLDAIVGGNQCTALDVSSDGALLAFSDFLDGKVRVYEVPPTAVLLEGKGGAYKSHLMKVRKDGRKLKVKVPASVRGE